MGKIKAFLVILPAVIFLMTCKKDLGTPPIAAFTGTPTTITTGQSVQFTDLSSNNPTSWYWEFGNRFITSSLQNPVYTFNTSKSYYIYLFVENEYGFDEELKYEYIHATADIIFNPDISYGTVADIEGNIYKTVQIGTQTWMAENLRTTKYNDDTNIPLVTEDTDWSNLTTPGCCWHNNQSLYSSSYGALYNWYAVNTGKLCPAGWHVPSNTEWTTFNDFLGGDQASVCIKLRETGMLHWYHWKDENRSTNETGFTALAGGYRDWYFGEFDMLGWVGYWWSSNAYDIVDSWHWIIFKYDDNYDDFDILGQLPQHMKCGLSVRCIKDN